MAKKIVPDPAQQRLIPALRPSAISAERIAESDLIVETCRYSFVRYEGTAAQLIEEGLIPEGFEWPRGRFQQRWKANGFSYRLRRARAAFYTGPKLAWMEADNWVVRVQDANYDQLWGYCEKYLRSIVETLEEDAQERLADSVGTPQWNLARQRHRSASTNPAFQDFLKKFVIVPAIKPGRKPTAATAAASQGAQS